MYIEAQTETRTGKYGVKLSLYRRGAQSRGRSVARHFDQNASTVAHAGAVGSRSEADEPTEPFEAQGSSALADSAA